MAHLRVIRSQVGRMRRLVDDLLDVSRIDRRGAVSIETVDFDLAKEVREAAARIAREHSDRAVEVDDPDRSAVARRSRSHRPGPEQPARERDQVLARRRTDLASRAERHGGEVEVRVADTGIGIAAGAPRERLRALLPGRWGRAGRRRFGGLGLGLYISRAIIDAHGGRIWSAPTPRRRAADRSSASASRGSPMPLASAAIAPTGEPPPFVVAPARAGDAAPARSRRAGGTPRAGAGRGRPARTRSPRTVRRMEESVAGRPDGAHGAGWAAIGRVDRHRSPRATTREARSVIVVAAPYARRGARAWDPAPDALARALAPVLSRSPCEPAGRIARYAHRDRLPRRAARPARGAGRGHPRGRACRPARWPTSTIGRSAERALRGPRGHRLDRQEHEPAHPRACRLLGLPRRDPQLGRCRADEPVRTQLRHLHALPDGLPDRRARRAAARSTRGAASAT